MARFDPRSNPDVRWFDGRRSDRYQYPLTERGHVVAGKLRGGLNLTARRPLRFRRHVLDFGTPRDRSVGAGLPSGPHFRRLAGQIPRLVASALSDLDSRVD